MLIKDIKQNGTLYILDKHNFTVNQYKAIKDVSYPYRDQTNAMKPMFNQSSMVVDLTLEMDGKTRVFTIPENLSTAYTGDLVISTGNDDIIREIESMRDTAKRELEPAVIERNKRIVTEADKLLSNLSQAYREKAESERKMAEIEASMSNMKSEMTEIKKAITDFINEFKK